MSGIASGGARAIVSRGADVLHKGAVLGLFTVFGFQAYQIGKNLNQGMNYTNHPQKEYIEKLRDKAEDDYKKYHRTDHRDWYDKDDNSFLDDAPKATPVSKKEEPKLVSKKDEPKKLKRFFR